MELRRDRRTGLDLMRIIAMLLIIAHHYVVHGGFTPVSLENFSGGGIFLQFLALWGKSACSLFALTSGFFLIESKGLRKHCKKIISLLGEITFYSFTILILVLLAGIHCTRADIIRSLFPVFGFNWYVQSYIVMYLFVPFLNPALKSLERKSFIRLIALIMIVWSILPSLQFFSSSFAVAWDFGSIDFFLVMYVIGAYIRLHVYGKLCPDKRWYLIAALSTSLLLFLTALGIDFLAVALRKSFLFNRVDQILSYSFPLGVAWAISVFLFFLHLDFSNRTISRIASTGLGIYLIHDHPLVRQVLWRQFFPNADYFASPYLHAFLKIFGVAIACILIDLLRAATVGKWFDRWSSQAFDRALTRAAACKTKKAAFRD